MSPAANAFQRELARLAAAIREESALWAELEALGDDWDRAFDDVDGGSPAEAWYAARRRTERCFLDTLSESNRVHGEHRPSP